MQDGPKKAAQTTALRELDELGKLDAAVQAMLAEDLPAQLAAAQQAVQAGSVEDAIAEIHSIRGSAAFCKLDRLHRAATNAEDCLRDQGLDAASGPLDTLAEALTAVCEELAAMRDAH